jgi:uncharacterized OB-fold protein
VADGAAADVRAAGPPWCEHLRAWACPACGHVAAYDHVACPCGADGRAAVLLSGEGVVWSTTAVADPDGPRDVVLVDAADAPGIRFLATWDGPDAATIGVRVAPAAATASGEPLPRVRGVAAGSR